MKMYYFPKLKFEERDKISSFLQLGFGNGRTVICGAKGSVKGGSRMRGGIFRARWRRAVHVMNFLHWAQRSAMLSSGTFPTIPQSSECSVSLLIVLVVEERSAPLMNTHVSPPGLLFSSLCFSAEKNSTRLNFLHYQENPPEPSKYLKFIFWPKVIFILKFSVPNSMLIHTKWFFVLLYNGMPCDTKFSSRLHRNFKIIL